MSFVQMKVVALVAVSALAIASCTSSNVYFFDRSSGITENSDGTTSYRIYLDAFGTPYPSNITASNFSKPKKRNQGSLWNMSQDPKLPMCKGETDGELAELCLSTSYEDLQVAQAAYWFSRAAEVVQMIEENDADSILVFLIHGFNVSNADFDYALARQQVAEQLGDKQTPVFIEINWDGFRSKIGLGAWGKAQASGPLAGFELRQLLNQISEIVAQRGIEQPPIRVITHSSGAFVAGAMFGDPIATLPELQDAPNSGDLAYDEFYRSRNVSEGPNRIPAYSDLKLGMLAPATTSTTFVGSEVYRGSGFRVDGSTLIVSINENDEILTKFFLDPNYSLLGATGLGADVETYCELHDTIGDKVNAIALDFKRDKTLNEDLRSHDFSLYLTQHQSTDFFALLFDNKVQSQFKVDCAEVD